MRYKRDGGGGIISINGSTGVITLATSPTVVVTQGPPGTFSFTATGGMAGIASLNAQLGAVQTFSNGFLGTAPAFLSALDNHALNIPMASTALVTAGLISNVDYTAFAAKQNALTIGTISDVGTDGITITGGIGAVIGLGVTLSQHVADATHNGYLSFTDWNAFDAKLDTAITSLNGLTDTTQVFDNGTTGTAPTWTSGIVMGVATHTLNTPMAKTAGVTAGLLSKIDYDIFNAKQSALTFSNSLVNLAGTVTLVNDSATPGNTKYYGTNGAGTLGYFSFPASGDTLQSVTTTGNTTSVSSLFQNATAIEMGKNVGGGNIAGSFKMWGAGNNNFYTTITTATQSANATYTLPTAMPASTGFLVSTNGGVMSWDLTAYYPASNPSSYITLGSLSGGTGISYSNITGVITNSAPDQTVAFTNGTGIAVTGTYPNFTVTNSAPDQVVAIASGTGINVTGTYPNFTVTNSSPGISYIFSTGLTDAANTITANLSTGLAGGQTAYGGTLASQNLTLSSTIHATKGHVYIGNADFDESVATGTNLTINGSGLAANYIDGLVLANTTTTIAGGLENSPTFRLRGKYFSTTDKTFDWTMTAVPASAGTHAIYLRYSDNGGAYSTTHQFLTLGRQQNSGSGAYYDLAKTATTTVSTDGLMLRGSSAATAGVPVRIGPRLRQTGAAWDGAASQTVNFIEETLPVAGATPTGSINWSYDLNGGGYTNIMTLTSTGRLGLGASTTPSFNLSFSGQVAKTIGMERHTTVTTAGNSMTVSAGAPKAGETDLAGGDYLIKSGISTGTGSSAIRLYTATASTTGNTDNNPTEKVTILGSGNVGIGVANPLSVLHLKAGTTAASTAPLKFTSGALMTNAESGAVEFLTDKYYATTTTGPTRKEIQLYDTYFGEGWFYTATGGASTSLAIDTTLLYHAMAIATTAGANAGFTHKVGQANAVASVADYSGTLPGTIKITTTGNHNLVVGEPITHTGFNTQTTYRGKYIVVATPSATEYVVTRAWVASDTGFMKRGFTLRANTGSAGVYSVTYSSCIDSAGANKVVKIKVNQNIVDCDNIACQVDTLGSGKPLQFTSSGMLTIADGDYIWLSVANLTDASDVGIYTVNLSMSRV